MTLYNVRVRFRFPTFRDPQKQTMTDDYTFLQEAMNQRHAASLVLFAIYGHGYKRTAELHVSSTEVWQHSGKWMIPN